jgi:hypothetical protein
MESSIVLWTVLDRKISRIGNKEPHTETACGSSFARTSYKLRPGNTLIHTTVAELSFHGCLIAVFVSFQAGFGLGGPMRRARRPDFRAGEFGCCRSAGSHSHPVRAHSDHPPRPIAANLYGRHAFRVPPGAGTSGDRAARVRARWPRER